MPFDSTTQTRPAHHLTFEQACGIVAGPTTLIDTREHCHGTLLGYGGPADPSEDGEGLVLTRDKWGMFCFVGPDGEVKLDAREAVYAALAILKDQGIGGEQ